MKHFSGLARTLTFFGLVLLIAASHNALLAQCSSSANPIVQENCLPGNPSSEWDISGADASLAGDLTIQGFATNISVNAGQTIQFKVNTDATSYQLNVYRMGYYGGMGARKIATVLPSATLPQTQPACLTDASTFLVDCGNWAVSASWTVPPTAVSGIYFAHLIRSDTGGDSHILFVVRNDSSQSDIIFQTADETWQAYNAYGGNSLYGGADTFDLPNRAYKVSYNRPFITRGFGAESATWVFGAEYPMVRWLEANGYNVTYLTGVDAAQSGGLITNHKIFLSVGHDEYWSGPHRASVQAALASGVNMAFFSGNEVFWKTRWENSIDGTNTPYRTLVCYKETLDPVDGGVRDPADPPTWTGTWRDPTNSPPSDGGQPENALHGTLFMVNGPGTDNPGSLSMQVPAADGAMRFWRNTTVGSQAPGATFTLPVGTLGYEWDADVDNGFRPAGAFDVSTATYPLTADLLLDFGATYGAGTATHHAMEFRAPSGALVFGAGTVQWSWGLDANHDNPFFSPNSPSDPSMQQATVNLFADMGVQPATLQNGLIAASKSTDTTPPVSTITSPASGSTVSLGGATSISGTATDSGGGVVAGVEVSVDGGQTWHPAAGRSSWSYSWNPSSLGTVTIQSRAADDTGNIETPSPGISVTVSSQVCPCEIWNPSNPSSTPTTADSGDGGSVEVGVKFYADTNGYITGIRFYKSSANTGTHIGNLWSSTGQLLATATFTNETSSGWQQVNFSSGVLITAGTVYVASYFAPAGHYSSDLEFFESSGLDEPPLHLLANSTSPNGVYRYGTASAFPSSSYSATNYWVDVVFIRTTINLSPASLSFNSQVVGTGGANQLVTVSNTASSTVNLTGITIAGTNASDFTQTNTCGANLAAGASCTVSVAFLPTGFGIRSAILTIADNAPASPASSMSLTGTGTVPPPTPGVCPCSIWTMSSTPATIDAGDGNGTELGVKFTSDQNGYATGVRFYKSGANTGTHIGNLWTMTGTLLGTVTYTNEGTSGWQQASFSTPVPIVANTTYIASYYAPAGHYSVDSAFFASSGVDNVPLHAPANSLSADGIYSYGPASLFPNSTFNSNNYWVDVVFIPNPMTLSPTALSFASQLVATSSTSQAVTLTNTGNAAVGLTGITIAGANSGDFTQTNNCPSMVAVGANCTINITFTPTATGTRTATLTVTDNALGGPLPITMSGTAIAPAVNLSASSLMFPSQIVGTSTAAQTVILINNGTAALSFTGITVTGTNSTDFIQVNNCGATLGIGSNCTISVTFVPSITGAESASVTIADNVQGSPQLIGLTGTGVASQPPPGVCPCSIWSPTATPAEVDGGDGGSVEVGVKFSASQNGYITGIRFYKSAANTGPHIGNLWTTTGTQLATVTFTNEGASGWQQMNFSNPVSITANTTYVASYFAPAGHYSIDSLAFTSSGVNAPPLQALANTVTPDGVFSYRAASSFPNSSSDANNYWVDVVFIPSPVGLSPAPISFNNQIVGTSSSPQVVTLSNTGTTALNISGIAISGTNSADFAQTNACGTSVAGGSSCAITLTFTPTGIQTRNAVLTITDNATGSPQTVALAGTGLPIPGACPCSIWNSTITPITPDSGDINGTEVGVKFTSDQDGLITGILFYKSAANTGTHIGNLWTLTGTQLATGTFTNESASGWQQLNFTSPVAITANTTYIASYFAPAGHYSGDGAYFASSGTDNPPLHALSNGISADGVYSYGVASVFPQSSFNATNYWVDVVFTSTTVALSPSVLSFNNQAVGSSSAVQTLTLSNNSNSTVNLSGITVTGPNSGDFTQTNTCGASAAPGANCLINITFTPSQTGPESATVTVTDDATSSPQTASLTGSGATQAVALAPTSLTFTSQSVGTTSPAQTITLSNTGSASLTLTNIAISGTNGADYAQTNTCGTSVAAGAFCSISVTFSPTTAGTRSASVTVTDNATGSPQTAGFTGTGAAPVAGLAPTALVFANQAVGTTSAGQTITLSNTGTATLTLSSIAITGTNSGDFAQSSTCGASVAAGANCSINVTFSPTAAGTRSATVTVIDNATGSPQAASLTGTGVAPAAGLAPTSLIFAGQQVGTTSAGQTIILSNTGTATLTLTSIAIAGTNSGDFAQTNTCGASVAAGATCSISVTFSPAASGTRNATVTVSDNAAGSPQTASLAGTGTTPGVGLAPSSLAFGNQTVGTTSAVQTITLSNTGTATLTLTSITITGTNTGDYAQTNTCGSSVAAGANCSINVTFKPTASGTRSAAVTVTDNGAGSPQSASLTGTGVTPAVSLSPTLLVFGNQLVNTTSAAKTITLTNTGAGVLALTSIAITGTNSGDFAQTNTCGTSVAAGGNCSINVTFRPTANSARSGTVSITDNSTGSPQTVPLSGTGGVPSATLSPSSINFANQVVGSTSAAQTITVTNNGTAALNLTISIAGTNSGDFAQTNTCPASVAIGGRCTVSVTFKPTASGTRTASVTFTDNAANSPQAVTLNGTATAPTAILSPASLTFSSQVAGTTSAAQTITLSNTGNATLTLASIAITGTNSGDFAQTNTCGTSVAVGGRCSINVTFKPTANGARSATLTLTDNALSSPQTASLSGTGLAPVVSLAPASLTYASQSVGTTSTAQTIILSNAGTATLTLTSIAITGTNSGDFAETNTCGTTVAVGGRCSINVTFKPTATGTRAASVSVADNATGSPQTASLTGTGLAPAASLAPTSLIFTNQAVGTTSPAKAITLSNTGTATLTLTSIAITGTNKGDFAQTNTCGTSVAAGAQCTISVTFKPTVAGTRTASVAVTDNATGSPQTVSLTGT